MFVFATDAGDVFTVYDWKATSLYDDGLEEGEESASPTPEEFWGNWNPETLHIGGRGADNRGGANPAAAAFKAWLLDQYRGDQSSLPH